MKYKNEDAKFKENPITHLLDYLRPHAMNTECAHIVQMF